MSDCLQLGYATDKYMSRVTSYFYAFNLARVFAYLTVLNKNLNQTEEDRLISEAMKVLRSKGPRNRWARLSKARRSEIAKKAINARWAKLRAKEKK